MSQSTPVRVRIAPSPTGLPHIGTFRTFLFNWLFARQLGGAFVIRIEDTDRERLIPGAVDALLDAVEWFGLDWDEGPRIGGPFGPYQQSERLAIYHEQVRQLIAEGKAYRCYCSTERLDALRKEQQARKEPPGYDRRCRDLSARERAEHEAAGAPSIVRFAVPDQGSTTFEDVVHGEVTWENRVLDDFVILKSDGFPTYHLAHLVDDHLMSISHVLRGDEWISSTPRHVLLYQALGWEPPRFAHLPTILGPDRKKLSKRHGPTGIAAFQEAGYLPEALINYLALCGWSPGTDEEIFSLPQLVERFSLERVSQSGAIFDHDKLDWFNGVYIRSLSVDALVARTIAYLADAARWAGAPSADAEEQDQRTAQRRAALGDLSARLAARGGMPASVAALVQDRLRTLSDVAELAGFFFDDHIEYDAALLVRQGASPEQIAQALDRAADLAEAIPELTHDALEAAYRALGEELGLKTAQFFMAMRVACTGRTATPPLFETMEALGRSAVVDRLRAGAAHLSETSSS